MAVLTVLMIAGLGRCGSSLMMQMLYAGGMPCVGKWPDFEVEQMMPGRPPSVAWLRLQEGRALKWLDPHNAPIPANFGRALIWLDRNLDEQAKSQIKFLEIMQGITVSRAQRRRWPLQLKKERVLALRAAGSSLGTAQSFPSVTTSFEVLLHGGDHVPRTVAAMVKQRFGILLDVPAMQRCVVDRATGCAPGLRIEAALLKSGGPVAVPA